MDLEFSHNQNFICLKSMKNYRFLFILICVSILSGCGLAKGVAGIALMPVQLATAVVDGVTGGKMHLSSKLNNGVNEAFRPGSSMNSQSIEAALSGKTFYTSGSVAYFNANGESLYKIEKENKIIKDRWSATNGFFCISKKISRDSCYDMRKKGDSILYGSQNEPITLKNGDVENLASVYADAKRKEAEKQAELERKQAEEKAVKEREEAAQKLAQQKAEAEQKLAQQKAEAEEKRCQASAKCRAQKEKEQRERVAAEQRSREAACDRLYIGKPVKIKLSSCGFFGCDSDLYYAQIVGVSKTNGLASAKVTESGSKYGKLYERSCSDF